MAGVRKRFPGRDRMTLPTHTGGKAKKQRLSTTQIVACIILVLVLFYFVWTWYENWRFRSMLYTPLHVPKVIGSEKDMKRFWGSYRPQVYFGMKTQSPHSLVTGLMWLQQYISYSGDIPIRHTCEQGDNLPRYGWLAHDSTSFGIQDIVERNFVLRTEFIKRVAGDHGGDWSWRINGQGVRSNVSLSLFFYAATDGQGQLNPHVREDSSGSHLYAITGITEELGNFVIRFPKAETIRKQRFHHTVVEVEGLHKIKDGVLRRLRVSKINARGGGGRQVPLYGVVNDDTVENVLNPKSKVVVHQVTLETPFEVEVVFESGSLKHRQFELSGTRLTNHLAGLKMKFDQKFEARFPLKKMGYDNDQVAFAKAALSNMIGGMGHFYGESLVQSEHEPKPVAYWTAPLLTAVPSRSFFPRGFLWDEGFHELLISKWDRELSLSVIGHWLDLVNVEGWIPREQILGEEARSKVPAEFVVQRNKNANPPTLFLAIQSIISGMKSQRNGITNKDKEILAKMYPRLQTWFNWFNTTQTGPLPGTYRWRGRATDSDTEMNPKTLTSGLDDYPRASHPSNNERHVDLRCWIAFAADALAKIAKEIGEDGEKYEQTRDYLTDNSILDSIHWSSELNMYADYGNHSEKVYLVKKLFQPSQPNMPPQHRTIRAEGQIPTLRFVNAYGYISLFPFLLQIIDPASPKLHRILQDLKDPALLWTDYGLRSLSRKDRLYMKRNTEHDPPYWRGQIWINMNFLAVRALKYYAESPTTPPEISGLAKEIYENLRANVVNNIYKEYRRTGYIWENYSDTTGQGQGCHPFTGWSALVVLMMAQEY